MEGLEQRAVSYTHLRALAALGKKIKESCPLVESRTQRRAWSTNGSVDVGTNPVSYTHLDVYKRQLPQLSHSISEGVGTLQLTVGTQDMADAYSCLLYTSRCV